LSKEQIIHEVNEAECPMLANLDMKKITKDEIIEHLSSACCPVLEKLAGI